MLQEKVPQEKVPLSKMRAAFNRAASRVRMPSGDGLFLGIVVALVVCWIWYSARVKEALDPQSRFQTYIEYRNQMPPPDELWLVLKGKEEFLVAFGGGSGLAIHSGPPAYVFDQKGRLVDWSLDIGDDSEFNSRWSLSRSATARTLSLSGADEWLHRSH